MPSFEFDRYEHSTVLCALIHYGMAVAIPDECIALLEKISPDPKVPWAESMAEARAKVRALNVQAVRAELEVDDLQRRADEIYAADRADDRADEANRVAAMREP